MSCVIEEIDPATDPKRYEDALERILIESGRDPTKFLAAVFAFLQAETKFFSQPDASKVLARLLRDVKKAAPPGKHVSGAATVQEPHAPAAHTNGTSQVRLLLAVQALARQQKHK